MLMSIVVGDINNDGILDIAISDFGSGKGNIGVLYGLDNGTFLVSKIYSTGINTDPSSIVICDIDNDGRLDFIVSNSNKNNIGIMLRDKSEPLGKQTMFSTGNDSTPYSVVVSHFNDDDHLDIAVANSKTNNIGIFLGYGNGSFAKQETFSTDLYSSPTFIAVEDFNNDKQMDIVVAKSNTSNICIFFGNGNGSFIISQSYSTGLGSKPSAIAVADLNKDNKTDIVVTDSGINNVLVFFGSDNGTFKELHPYSLDYGSHPISVAIGDFNNDTWLDIVVADYGTKLSTMTDQSSLSANLKQFLTEEQIEIERQRRQADWERVRSATDPIEAPGEVFDSRSLYEKLKVQHDTKKKEYEDMWAAKNSIRGLDEDETDFLTRLDHAKIEKQRELKRMEQEEIEELKISFYFFLTKKKLFFLNSIKYKAQKELETISTNTRPISTKQHITPPVVNKQKQLLSGIVKRKSSTNESLKRPLEDDNEEDDQQQIKLEPPARLPRLLIPGGRLPGIGPAEGFTDSSDSSESSDEDGLSRYSNNAGIQSSIAQRKKLVKQLQDIAAASTGGGE
ncbi:unnamed protein product [Rotaria sordida]|uniref:FAM192A/Fyv6 N-terminal domain-containing protein n=2 Tax=Rotaria sordida TaxID=392033 RepID=A0A819N481_9BILA|nr:unnamed protein product [Rotaria sordida]